MKKKLATHHLECYLTSGRIERRKRVSRLEAEHPNPRQILQLIAKSLLPNLFSYSHLLPPVQLGSNATCYVLSTKPTPPKSAEQGHIGTWVRSYS